MKAFYLNILFLIIVCSSYGQLTLRGTVGPGQYFNPTQVHLTPNTTSPVTQAAGSSSGVIHLFIDASSVTSSTSYSTQLPTSILSSGSGTGPNTSLAVGKTPTSYGVSGSGGATYTVPIVLPPGTMGAVPNVAISYNSQGTEGSLGYGWGISGLSCISRSGKTPYHNYGGTYPDQAQAVTLTNADWFALDGNRLIATSGTNGDNGTIYATESETFDKIVSNGTVGSGPDWFQVQTKNGAIIEYGHSLDSRLIPVGLNTVDAWYVDKITDQFGNYITFHYINTDGEIHIQEIDYTGNSNAGFAPYNSIVFAYTDKTETNTTYVAGGALNSSAILSTITIKAHNTLFKEYSFKYAYNTYTLLQEIDETGSDGSALNPTRFSYGSDIPVLGSTCGSGPTSLTDYCVEGDPSVLGGTAGGTSGFGQAAQYTLLDYNGDGKEDVISLTGTYGELYTTSGEHLDPPDGYNFGWNSQVLYTGEGNACPLFTANGYGFPLGYPVSGGAAGYLNPINNTASGSLSQVAQDFNGDGKEDYLVSTFPDTVPVEGDDYQENVHIALSTGSSFTSANTLEMYGMVNTTDELTAASAPADAVLSANYYLDLNGDGQLDAFNYHYDPVAQVEYYRVWLNAGASSTTPQEQPSMTYPTTPSGTPSPNFEITVSESGYLSFLDFSQAIPMDLYGDGRTELVNVTQYNNNAVDDGAPRKVIVSFNADQVYGQPGYVAEVDGSSSGGSTYVSPVPGNGIVIQADNSGFSYNNNAFVPNTTNQDETYTPSGSGESYDTYFPPATDGYDNVFGVTTSINNASPYVQFGDFNGDGITDILSYSNSSNTWTINFGTGAGTYAQLPVSTLPTDNPFSYPSTYYYAHDVNGDGKTDILEFLPPSSSGATSTVIKIYYSTGTSFIEGEPITLPNHDINPETWQIAFGDFNGDGVDDLLLENNIDDGAINGPPVLLYFYSGTKSRRLAEAVDGYNQLVQFTYQPLTNSSIYSQPQASSYRSTSNSSSLLDIQAPVYVVSRMTTVDGTGNNSTATVGSTVTYTDSNSTTYTYQDLIYNKLGLGMLGFLNVTSYNSVKDYSSSNTYAILPTYSNLVPSSSSVTAVTAATVLSTGTYTYTPVALGGLRYFLSPTQAVTNDNIAGTTATTTYTYDAYGNVTDKNTQISVTSTSSVVETTDAQNTYVASGTWIPSSVATTTNTSTYLSNPSYARSVLNTWDGSGHLLTATMDPSTGEAVTNTNTYDPNTGVLTKQITSSADGSCSTQTNSYGYDSYSQFKTSSTNSLNQTTDYTYNFLWGKPASVTTPDGLTTTYTYDGYGRSAQIVTPDGLTQTLTYHWVTSGELPIGGSDPFSVNSTSLYSVNSFKVGSPPLNTFYDWFDRKTLLETTTLSANVFQEQSYDAMGHSYQSTNTYQKASIPSEYGDYDPVITTNIYNDIKYRLTSSVTTCSSAPTLTSSVAYSSSSGNTTVKTTKPDGTVSSQTTDPAGMMINSTDYVTGSPTTVYSHLTYNYFSNGHTSSIVLNGQTVNTFTYDAYGRQTSLTDVNFGGSGYTYIYNAYNHLTYQQNPNGDTYNMTYDVLGRLTQKVSSKEGTYSYTYYTSGDGLNMLHTQTLGTNSISYTYDNLHRPLSVNVNGLTTSYTYDPTYGYLATKTFPGSGFSITNTYDANHYGFLTETKQTSNGNPIWQAEYMNPYGQYVDYIQGTDDVHTIKSYTPYDLLTGISAGSYENMTFSFDPTNSNLLSRTEGSLSESFSYDGSLNSRLTEAKSTYPTSLTTTADVVMSYDPNGNIINKSDICGSGTTYSQGNSNNQITQVPNSSSLISSGQTVTYTSFNAPLTLALGNYTMNFTYGPDNNREQTTLTDNLGNTTVRNFASGYENTSFNSGALTEVNYIQCGGSVVGMYVNTGGSGDMYYVYTDHLGSILTVTDGTNTYNQSFDAWGNYRNPTDGSYSSIPTNPAWLYRGFTGHEHLPEFQLINANGRLYDPLVNSFLSPDVTTQAPTNTQNFNRYSYCLNNPLKYTDPSGFQYFLSARAMLSWYNAVSGCSRLAAEWDGVVSLGDGGDGGGFGGDGAGDGGGGDGNGGSVPTWASNYIGDGNSSSGSTGTGADKTSGTSTIPGTSASASAQSAGVDASYVSSFEDTFSAMWTAASTAFIAPFSPPNNDQTNDGFNVSTNDVVSTAATVAVTTDNIGTGLETLGLLGNSNSAWTQAADILGSSVKWAGPVGFGFSTMNDYSEMKAGTLSQFQFGYNLTGGLSSIAVGLEFGGPVGGAFGLFWSINGAFAPIIKQEYESLSTNQVMDIYQNNQMTGTNYTTW